MKKLSWMIGGVTLLASGMYIFVYLYRWEWNRALFVSIVFVATEIALATALVLRQVRRSAAGAAGAPSGAEGAGPDPRVLARLREAPTHPDRFAWLTGDLTRMNVFITILLGGGAVLSAGAWVLDRLAHRTAGSTLDRSLATKLGALAFPTSGLLAEDAELIASEAPYADDPELRLLLGPVAGGR